MIAHPSLSSPFVPPPALQPREKMPRNELCWCLSGRKYKRCHLDRERQSPINIYEHAAALREKFAAGYCSHPLANATNCSSKIISSHTVQRRGGLANITEGGHVLTTKTTLEDLIRYDGVPQLRRVGA